MLRNKALRSWFFTIVLINLLCMLALFGFNYAQYLIHGAA